MGHSVHVDQEDGVLFKPWVFGAGDRGHAAVFWPCSCRRHGLEGLLPLM